MAGGMDMGGGRKGGKKSLDAPLNLVPFIDLMAVTIVFLILNAVWIQLGRLQVSQSGQSADDVSAASPQQPVTLLISERDLKLSVGGALVDSLPITRDDLDRINVEKLVAKLKELKSQQPEQAAITLSTEDSVKYADLIRLIDSVTQDGSTPLFPSVAVSPASPN